MIVRRGHFFCPEFDVDVISPISVVFVVVVAPSENSFLSDFMMIDCPIRCIVFKIVYLFSCSTNHSFSSAIIMSLKRKKVDGEMKCGQTPTINMDEMQMFLDFSA